MKFLEQGLKTGTTHDVPEYIIVEHVRFILGQITMNTTTNYCPMTKV